MRHDEQDEAAQDRTELSRCLACGVVFAATIKQPWPSPIRFCICCGEPVAADE
jgi:uncharacterized Zn finger protein